MSLRPALLMLLAMAPLLAVPRASGGGDNPLIERHLYAARRALDEGKVAEARRDVERALERDDQHLGALLMWAEVAEAEQDADTTAYALHSWLTIVSAAERAPADRKTIAAVEERLAAVDPDAKSFRALTDDYVKELRKLEKEHSKRGRLHSAIALVEEVLHILPRDAEAQRRLKEIRRTGGADVATEDLYAGADPALGADPEWIAEFDAEHASWDGKASKESDNYIIHTDAGYMVLQTAAIAMEQMNQAYRVFFRYMEDGGPTPRIDVNIFKDRDEYLKLGKGPPVEWSAGHFTGDAVETYAPGAGGGASNLLGMYHTLFHEAAHQFVSLTGRGGVPGWLNEAYASFFEGTVLLSNGTVRWNQVNTGRLFALAPRMDKGWMADHTDGVRGPDGDWGTPDKAPTLRILIENEYAWGPPWYAPTWGVVYFLYNYRDAATGKAIYRDPLHEYYLSGAAHKGLDGRIPHFEEIVLSGKDSPVQTVDELNELWKEWILAIRDAQLGRGEGVRGPEDFGDAALARGDLELAAELYEEAWLHAPDDPELLWKLANALEELDVEDRAAALYRGFSREIELRGEAEVDERYPVALRKVEELDPLYRRHRKLMADLEVEGLALAQTYRERGMPRMALEIARRMSASFSMPAALAFYTEVAEESGVSLARWKLAYNEFDLDGWSDNKYYRAYGKMIEAVVAKDASIETPEGSYQVQMLPYDAAFEGDYSLETRLRFRGAALMGLAFGTKDNDNTHAVVLYEKGQLDVSTKAGNVWTVRDHLQVPLEGEWHALRIDVVSQEGPRAAVDIYLDGKWLRSVEMPRDSVRGGFGLITGEGDGDYEEIRLLARDPHDPAARIERELARKQRESDESLRVPGVFQGFRPPELEGGEWMQGPPLVLADALGRPLVLAFWTPHQEELIPTAAYYQYLAESWRALGIRVAVVASNSETPATIELWLAERPMPDVAVLRDSRFTLYPKYKVGNGGWEIPRVLLIDVDGKVAWEGDPNLRLNIGWEPERPVQTPVDVALEALVERRHLRELEQYAPRLDEARALFQDRAWRAALEMLAPLADLEADFDPRVQEARELRRVIEAEGTELPVRAEAAQETGRPLLAHLLLTRAQQEFPGTAVADLAAPRLRRLERSAEYKDAMRAWREFERAAQAAERGKEPGDVLGFLDKAAALSGCTEVVAAHAALKEALLGDGGGAAVAALWPTLQPSRD